MHKITIMLVAATVAGTLTLTAGSGSVLTPEDYTDIDSVAVEDVENVSPSYEANYSLSTYVYADDGLVFPLESFEDDLDAGNYKKVESNALEVLERFPGDPFARYSLSLVYDKQGKHSKAIKAAVGLLVDYPSDATAYSLVDYYAYNNGADKVVKEYEKQLLALEKKPGFDKLAAGYGWEMFATLCNAYGFYRKAMQAVNRERRFIEYNDDMRMIEQLAYYGIDRPDKSLELTDACSDETKNYSYWRRNRAVVLRAAKSPGQAIEYEKAELEQDSAFYDMAGMLATDLTLAARYAEALDVLDRYIYKLENDPDVEVYTILTDSDHLRTSLLPELYLRRGIVKKLSGDETGAVADFDKVPDANEAASLYILAQAYLGNRTEAEQRLEESFSGSPSFAASVYNVLGIKDKALKSLEQAYRRNLWSPLKTMFDINQRSLVNETGFSKVASRFKP